MTMVIWILLASLVLLGLLSWLLSKFLSHKGRMPADAAEQNSLTDDEACCGQHLVCEQDSLLYQGEEIVYYDDEELDAYKGQPAETYTETQLRAFEDVFYSLQDSDMAGWLRSLQQREINLPLELRDQALMIVSERRQNTQ